MGSEVLPTNNISGKSLIFEEVTGKLDSSNVDCERDMISEKIEVNADLLSPSDEHDPPVKEEATATVSEVLPITDAHVANSSSKGLTEKLATNNDDETSESASKEGKLRRKEDKDRKKE